MLVAAIVGLDTRATMDIDTTVRAINLTMENAREVIQDIIVQKYFEKTGVNPPAAEVRRIDRTARPPCFKNQQGELNG